MADRHLVLTEQDWEFIFNALQLSRTNFANNPVLVDIMAEELRDHFIERISDIMDRIGYQGTIASQKGIAPNVQHEDSPQPNG
jgi:hypothetical protein